MIRNIVVSLAALLVGAASLSAQAVVRYDQGRRLLNGVVLLQSVSDSNAYYYVPKFPRLAMAPDSSYKLLMLKYVGAGAQPSGGLLHALVTFDLLPDQLDSLQAALKQALPRARLVGPVPLTQTKKTGEELPNTFQIVSATLSDTGQNRFTRSVVHSSRAPITSGSEAALAALLSPEGATLLWDSFRGTTSDVSVAVHAQFEAAVHAYDATITAEMNTVYRHFSLIGNSQKDYSRRQIREVVDSLAKNGVLKVEVNDLAPGTARDMEGILQLVTDKLTTLLFDHTTGWSKEPDREAAVEADQLKGRQEEGFFAKVFGGGDTPYYTDDQYVLKDITNIQQRSFRLYLNKGSTVTVPLDASGNLGGFFRSLADHDRYFRIVNLADAAFEKMPVTFQVDLAAVEAFQDLVNTVSVSVRKSYADSQPAFTTSFQITPEDIKAGKLSRTVEIPRLGATGADWQSYEYRAQWSLRGAATVPSPSDTAWVASSTPGVTLRLPFERYVVELDANRALFGTAGFDAASAQFATVLLKRPAVQRQITLRAKDAESTSRVVLYRDAGAPVVYKVSWHGARGAQNGTMQALDGSYLLLTPPVTLGGTE
jgi:hypothetical protein